MDTHHTERAPVFSNGDSLLIRLNAPDLRQIPFMPVITAYNSEAELVHLFAEYVHSPRFLGDGCRVLVDDIVNIRLSAVNTEAFVRCTVLDAGDVRVHEGAYVPVDGSVGMINMNVLIHNLNNIVAYYEVYPNGRR